MPSNSFNLKPFDKPRDFNTFEPFANLPSVDANILDQWLSSTLIQPISAVEWDWTNRWVVGPRIIADSMWFWFEKGSGWGWIGDENNRFEIKTGDLMLIPQGILHNVGQDLGINSHVVAVHFYANVYQTVNLMDLLGFPAHIESKEDSPFQATSLRLSREYALKAPGWSAFMASEIFKILLYIVRNYGNQFHPPFSQANHTELHRLLPVLKLIESNLDNNELSVGDLASKIHLSEVQFRKIFQRTTGLSPVRFIQRQRIERACTLLHTTSESVAIIADKCGFSDLPFFTRVFKMWTGKTPTGYRNRRGV
jgi:AraC-like DNA-binding protein